jgi:hypothetical protein
MSTSTKNEEYIYELLETSAFEDLTAEDQALVRAYMGEENYRLQYQLLLATQTIPNEKHATKPLVLPTSSTLTIPLYQAVLAVAAVVAFFLVIWPKSNTSIRTIYKEGPTQVSTNTIHDTIFQKVVREKVVYKTINNNNNNLTETTTEIPAPVFAPQELASEKIMSLKDDPIAQQFMAEMAMYEGR